MTDTNKEEFTDENIPSSNWFSFAEVGNSIKGTFVNKFEKEGSDGMPDQVVFELTNCEVNGEKQEDDWNVGIKKSNSYVLSRISKAKFGQRIGFLFEKEIPASKKGYNPAKSIKPYVWGMDDTYEPMDVIEEKTSLDDLEF